MARRLLLLLAFGACRPDFEDRTSAITERRVLAVKAEPAEARPGDTVTFAVFVAGPAGAVAAPSASWAFCVAPKALTENGAVSADCLSDGVRRVGEGLSTVSAPLPADACSLFGPDVTSADLRPRDPDSTGGYYQPIRVRVDEATIVGFGMSRLRCNLASAGAEVAADYDRKYSANTNPTLAPIAAFVSGTPLAFDAIPRGARVTLRASWPAESAEDYVALDRAAQRVVPRRESMRVSWFASGGSFANDRTGRSEDEREPFTDNEWSSPAQPGTTHLFVVLRDSRGGTAWTTSDLVVR